jgi:hypothetical protein
MKILPRPGDVLTALLARAAVTTGRLAPGRADKFVGVLARLYYFLGDCQRRERN